MLFNEIVDGRTLKDHKSSLSTSCSGELKINVNDGTFDYLFHMSYFGNATSVNFKSRAALMIHVQTKRGSTLRIRHGNLKRK